MWPREHGAYGQVALPLLTAFVAAGVSTAGLLMAVAVVAAFLAHEPAAVLLGLRGARVKRELRHRAIRWLACTVVAGVAAGTAALLKMHPDGRWSLAVPLVPAVLLAIAAVRGQEKSSYGETTASLAFAGTAMPVSVAAPVAVETAVTIAMPFALLFVANTLAVRVVILSGRGGGDAAAATAARRLALSLVAGASTVLAAIIAFGLLPPSVLVAAAPGLLTAGVVAMRPPKPSRLRALGWTLILVSVATASIVIATT